jgi:hypothetical protein
MPFRVESGMGLLDVCLNRGYGGLAGIWKADLGENL